MLSFLDSLLSRLTMYRLMLYYLIVLVFASLFLSGYNPIAILAQTLTILLTCYLANLLFSRLLKVPTNFESFAITALILSLIFGPIPFSTNLLSYSPTILLSLLAMSSKYLLAINRRHLFNPAAFAITLTAILFHHGPSWWIGSESMLPFLTLGGLLILRKLHRFSLVFVFLLTTILLSFSPTLLLSPVVWFFATAMLIEPQTSPVFTKFQIVYAAFVALVFRLLPLTLPSIPYPLEISLLIGNIFSYLTSPTSRFLLKLNHKLKLNTDTFAFYFLPDKKFNFLPGQYLEWTLCHPKSDSRGTRRFFTIASSPTEPETLLVSRFADNGSSFKKALLSLPAGRQVFANGPAGEFTLAPSPLPLAPLVFIAGGIGITPFRSMAKFLADTNQTRDITLLYSAKSATDFLFQDIFTKAKIKAVYTTNRINEELIIKGVPDYKERLFYVSGPEPMVQATEKILRNIGVSRGHIKRDYFPGY